MKLILILGLIFYSVILKAQVTEEWVKSYAGPLNEGAKGIKVLTDNGNNIFVFGDCDIQISTNFTDLALLKYNPDGTLQWERTYNNPDDKDDIAGDMVLDINGNVFITGATTYLDYNYFSTIAYSPMGNQIWASIYNSNPPSQQYNNPVAIDTDDNGNTFVAALSSYQAQVSDYLTVKYNQTGILQWDSRFNDGADYPYDMKVDNSGNVYVTGYSTSDSTGYDIKTVKYNNSGVLQWSRVLRASLPYPLNNDCVLEIDSEGNIYVGATCYGPYGDQDLALVKYSSDGNNMWVKYYGSPSYDKFSSLTIDNQNYVYVTGYVKANSNTVCAVIRYNTGGELTKEILYDGPGTFDNPTDIKIDGARNIYVTGDCRPVVNTNTDYFTLKYDSAGIQQWVKTYNGVGNGNDESYSIALDNLNNVYITGRSSNDSAWTMTTIKYSQTTGIQTLSNELPQRFSLEQNYPNPFNPSTNIKFEVAKASHVKLVIYDALGREISVLANESMQPGSYNANFSADGLNSGIYFYSLITDSYKETKKMILLK
jgi:hypothetical protein